MSALLALGLLCAAAAPPTARATEQATEQASEQSELDSLLDDVFSLRWLDPQDPYWTPRRGARFEVSAFVGGEGAFAALAPDRLPTVGGINFQSVARYYPVDRLAVVVGGRSYFGLDGVPATGTTASSVFSLVTGVRYDLVRENRFSLLWDLYSGPSVYVFTDLSSTKIEDASFAIGGEMGSGLALRYTLGPFTGELRGLAGGRAGATSNPFQRASDSGPFSSLYVGVDSGISWSIQ